MIPGSVRPPPLGSGKARRRTAIVLPRCTQTAMKLGEARHRGMQRKQPSSHQEKHGNTGCVGNGQAFKKSKHATLIGPMNYVDDRTFLEVTVAAPTPHSW
eukprot:2936476-Pleurochrysis_carterae.AAC.1